MLRDRDRPSLLDQFVSDPTGLPPMCDQDEFANIMEGIVADFAPRLFAIVQEYGTRVDGRVAAWGMAFEDHAEVYGVDGQVRMGLAAPESAVSLFHFGNHIRARLVWFDADAKTGTDELEEM